MKQNTLLNNSIAIHCVNDTKFQSVYTTLKIVFKMKSKQNTVANLLAQMMSDRLESAPTKALIAERLDLLYGAKMGSTTYSMGQYQVIDLSVVAIANQYVETDLTQAQITLLADMLYEPLLNQNSFDEAVKNLRLNHSRLKENPAQFAVVEGFKVAGQGQTFALSAMGDLTDLESITLSDVLALHKECIEVFNKTIHVVGPLTSNLDFSRFEKGRSGAIDEVLLKTRIPERTHDVMYDGKQTELVLMYETDITPLSDNYAAYLVFIAHLGQLPSSLLFQNVREKHSLCYSIYAQRQIFDGMFYIATGINDKNCDKALSLIKEQIITMQEVLQDISPSKQYLTMQMEGVSENQKSIASQNFRNDLLKIESSPELIQKAIAAVSPEDVMAVAKGVKPGFIYRYRGVSHEEN